MSLHGSHAVACTRRPRDTVCRIHSAAMSPRIPSNCPRSPAESRRLPRDGATNRAPDVPWGDREATRPVARCRTRCGTRSDTPCRLERRRQSPRETRDVPWISLGRPRSDRARDHEATRAVFEATSVRSDETSGRPSGDTAPALPLIGSSPGSQKVAEGRFDVLGGAEGHLEQEADHAHDPEADRREVEAERGRQAQGVEAFDHLLDRVGHVARGIEPRVEHFEAADSLAERGVAGRAGEVTASEAEEAGGMPGFVAAMREASPRSAGSGEPRASSRYAWAAVISERRWSRACPASTA